MATIDLTNITRYFDTLTQGTADFAEVQNVSSTSFEWTTSAGHTIIATGTGITAGGANNPTGGTITSIAIYLGNIMSAALPYNAALPIPDVLITDINIDLMSFDFTSSATSNTTFWDLVSDGETDIVKSIDNNFEYRISGDFTKSLTNGTFTGADDTFTEAGTDRIVAHGDAYEVLGDAILHGGDDNFTGTYSLLSGDASYAGGTSRVFGGNDTITITGSADNIQIIGDVANIYGNAILYGGDDIIDMRGSSASTGRTISGDVVSFGNSSTLIGGNDLIYASDFGDAISGDALLHDNMLVQGASTIIGGDDTIHGGAGDDTISGDLGLYYVSPGYNKGGNDVLYGYGGNDSISGNGGRDKIYDGSGDDTVDAGDGDDYVRAGGGADNYDGGAGTDYISYYSSTGGIKVNLGENTISRSWAYNDTIANFEGFSGSKIGNDTITGSAGDNLLRGYGGDDKFYVGAGNDTVDGGTGNDYVRAGDGVNTYDGGDGDDDYISFMDSTTGVLVNLETGTNSGGFAEGDTIVNFESVSGSLLGNDTITGTSGNNRIKTYGGDDSIDGGDGNDKLYGGAGNDTVNGGAGDDYVRAGDGVNTYNGGDGDNDYISYYNSVDGVLLDLYKGYFSGTWASDDTVTNFEHLGGSNTGDDRLYASETGSRMRGHGGNDTLGGFGGDDTLYGGAGDDVLTDHGGTNVFYGGTGADTFQFEVGTNATTIKDFEDDIDVIDFSGLGFSTEIQAMTFAVQDGADVVFDIGMGNVLTIENATLAQVSDDIVI